MGGLGRGGSLMGGGQGLTGAQKNERGRQGSKAGWGEQLGPSAWGGNELGREAEGRPGRLCGEHAGGQRAELDAGAQGVCMGVCVFQAQESVPLELRVPRARRTGKAAGKTDLEGANARDQGWGTPSLGARFGTPFSLPLWVFT